jgi:Zn-dependent protease with chaperone function
VSAWLGFFWLLFLCALASWVLAALGATVLSRWPAVHLSPGLRARRAVLIALLPWLLPLTTVVSVIGQSASKSLGLIADHCLYHGPGHPHLCLEHLPAISLSHLHLAGAAGALLLVLTLLARYLVRERRVALRLRSMRSLSHGFGRLRVLEYKQSLALAANLRDPFVLMSRGLLDRLTRRGRRIVLAHEIAHLRHNDLLRNYVFEVLLLLHLPWAVGRLRGSWRQALEERADDSVAARFGGDSVAQALVQVIRGSRPGWTPAFSVSGADSLRRIERLLSPDENVNTRSVAFEVAYVGLLLAVGLTITTSHHRVETVLGVLTGG